MGTRLEVLKTYKIYIGGKFPRTESGRYYEPSKNGVKLGNICRSSRKDFRNAVQAARGAQEAWASRAAFNRSQIIYRIAEMLEGRSAQFIEELTRSGVSKAKAEKEVELSIDRLIYYAGWADKYQQVFSSVNPVASSHFNFSVYEPQGVVAVIAPEKSGLLGLISAIVPAIIGGNTVVVLASESLPTSAISFAEVLHSSDVPGGVINILTGHEKELISHIVKHMDVNALLYCRPELDPEIDALCHSNMKRLRHYHSNDWGSDKHENPYIVLDFQEVKTTWHPIEHIGGAGSGY